MCAVCRGAASPSFAKLPNSLPSSHNEINEGAYPMAQQNYENPDELVIAAARLFGHTVDDHPNPKKRTDGQSEEHN